MVERLKAEGRLVKVEPHVHSVGHSQRSGEPVEPMLSPQWFADVSGMAQEALAVVENGEISLIPSSWDRTWEHWLRNIRPWVISRSSGGDTAFRPGTTRTAPATWRWIEPRPRNRRVPPS